MRKISLEKKKGVVFEIDEITKKNLIAAAVGKNKVHEFVDRDGTLTASSIVDIRCLDVDEDYQTESRQKIDRKLSANFKMSLCDDITLSYRDGKLFTVDGSHRKKAAWDNGYQFLKCKILFGLSKAQEAEMFANQSKYTANIRTTDTFHANLCTGEPVDTAIYKCAKAAGMNMSNTKFVDKAVTAFTACRYVIKAKNNGGPEALSWIFTLFNDSYWSDQYDFGTDAWVRALFNAYDSGMTHGKIATYRKNLLAVMKKVSPAMLRNFSSVWNGDENRANMKKLMHAIAEGEVTYDDIQRVKETGTAPESAKAKTKAAVKATAKTKPEKIVARSVKKAC